MKLYFKQSQLISLILVVITTLITPTGALAMPQYAAGEVQTTTLKSNSASLTVTSVTCADANPTSADSVAFTVTFSAAVIDVDLSNFTLTTTGVSSASVTSMSGSGSTYTVTVNTGTGDGTIQLNVIDNDNIEDLDGNYFNAPFSSGEVYIINKTAPTVGSVTLADANPTNAASVDFTVTFSAAVIDVDISNFTLTTTGVDGASVSSVSGSGDTYTVTVNTGTGSGTIQLNVIDNDNIEDLAGNYFDSPTSSSEVYIIEKTALTVTAVTLANANPASTSSVDFTVTFSAAVIDVDISDFTLTTTRVSDASISSVSGSGDTYTVTVNTGTGGGTIQLNVIDNDNIEDLDGNYFNSPFSAGEVYIIEKTASTAASDNFIVAFYKSVIEFFQRLFRAAPVDNK